jgi:hypothetical protein
MAVYRIYVDVCRHPVLCRVFQFPDVSLPTKTTGSALPSPCHIIICCSESSCIPSSTPPSWWLPTLNQPTTTISSATYPLPGGSIIREIPIWQPLIVAPTGSESKNLIIPHSATHQEVWFLGNSKGMF